MSLGQKHKRQRKLDSTDPIIIIAANKTISTGNVIGKTARGKKFKGERENRKVKPGKKHSVYYDDQRRSFKSSRYEIKYFARKYKLNNISRRD